MEFLRGRAFLMSEVPLCVTGNDSAFKSSLSMVAEMKDVRDLRD
jgi:hypothetical protein